MHNNYLSIDDYIVNSYPVNMKFVNGFFYIFHADRTESTFLSVPPNPFYFTPQEPIVLNWTFSPSNQYRVELFEYIESWKVWDMIFKSLVWLPRYSYYKYGDRLKFTTQPQSTITYTYSKSEDAGRKRFWLYSYKSDGSFTLEETITEFIVKEGILSHESF